MIRFTALSLLCAALSACASPQHEPRQCPMGQLTEISVESNASPADFALETAARSTLNAGYEKFSVVQGTGSGKSYVILIKMIPLQSTELPPNTYNARDILAYAMIPTMMQAPVL